MQESVLRMYELGKGRRGGGLMVVESGRWNVARRKVMMSFRVSLSLKSSASLIDLSWENGQHNNKQKTVSLTVRHSLYQTPLSKKNERPLMKISFIDEMKVGE